MPTINFYLNNDKRSSHKEKAIFCYVRGSGQTLTLNTGERIDPKYWEPKTQKAKRSYPGNIELNDYLARYADKIRDIIRSAKREDPCLPFEQIKNAILKEFKNHTDVDFYEVFDIFIETRKPTVSKATTGKFTTLRNQIKAFAEAHKIKVSFDAIDLIFFDRLHNYFLSIGISNNTIHKNMQFIQSFLRWAYEREYTKNNKFEDYKNVKLVDTDNIALTKGDIAKLLECDPHNDRLRKVRDVFMFQLYTGQRYSDIAKFKSSDVKDGVWYLRQAKTKKPIEIPLIAPAIQILTQYNFELPVLSNQKMNQYLKELGKAAKLDDNVTVSKFKGAEMIEKTLPKYELLTTHTARRTFVSLASYDGVNQQVVMSFTGHGTDKMVEKYFKKNNSDSKKVIEELFCN